MNVAEPEIKVDSRESRLRHQHFPRSRQAARSEEHKWRVRHITEQDVDLSEGPDVASDVYLFKNILSLFPRIKGSYI